MKKIVATILVFLISLSLVSCGSKISDEAKKLSSNSKLNEQQAQSLIDTVTSIGVDSSSITMPMLDDNVLAFSFSRDNEGLNYSRTVLHAEFNKNKVATISMNNDPIFYDDGKVLMNIQDYYVNDIFCELFVDLIKIELQYTDIPYTNIVYGKDWSSLYIDNGYVIQGTFSASDNQTHDLAAFYLWDGDFDQNPILNWLYIDEKQII